MDDLDRLCRRYVRLLSLIERTSSRIGDPNLLLTHTDSSLLAFDPRHPSPWLEDIGQMTYLLRNHGQVTEHGKASFMSRLLLVPSQPPVCGPDLFVYYATVKAVAHLQLYEGIRLYIMFVEPNVALDIRFNFTVEQVKKKKHSRVWPSPDYYGDIEKREVIEAEGSAAEAYLEALEKARSRCVRIAPYRDEHFLLGGRLSLPSSWRWFLLFLSEQRCMICSTPLHASALQIDHGRPLHPEEDQCRPTPSGNSNLFNLGALCRSCNSKKSNKNEYFPEMFIPKLIPDARLREYFKASLKIPPALSEHRVPERAPADGQFP
jgi:5-methylcytosine-specific restriction endonuclease McrA